MKALTDADIEALRRMDWAQMPSDSRFEPLDAPPLPLHTLNGLQLRIADFRRLSSEDPRVFIDALHVCLVARCFIIARQLGRPEMTAIAERILALQPLEPQELDNLETLMMHMLIGHPRGTQLLADLEAIRERSLTEIAPKTTAN